jgi:uncharacterized membrane protein YvbJ
MVYCSKCGAKNEDDARTCKKCGERLYPTHLKKAVTRGEDTCFGPRERRGRHVDECFGIPRFGALFGMAIGLIIVLFGIGWVFSRYYNVSIEVWPIAVIIFGLLIFVAAFYAFRGKYGT